MARVSARLISMILLVWAGLATGVAFVATPAKFLAPSLSLPVALDVGRHTFAVSNRLELLFLAVAAACALFNGRRVTWGLLLAVPGTVLFVQKFWLLPALDERVSELLAGHAPATSGLHGVYVAAEAVKIACLFMVGFLGPMFASETTKPLYSGR